MPILRRIRIVLSLKLFFLHDQMILSTPSSTRESANLLSKSPFASCEAWLELAALNLRFLKARTVLYVQMVSAEYLVRNKKTRSSPSKLTKIKAERVPKEKRDSILIITEKPQAAQ